MFSIIIPQPHGNHSFYQNTTGTAIIVTSSTEKHYIHLTVLKPSKILFQWQLLWIPGYHSFIVRAITVATMVFLAENKVSRVQFFKGKRKPFKTSH